MTFDIQRYLNNSRRLDTSDIDWDDVPNHPLSRGERAFLQYAMDVEDHTIVYLKELLATDVVRDPDVTAFLSCWAYEEHFHGLALERFLAAYEGADAPQRDMDARLAREGRFRRAAKRIAMPLIGRLSPDFAATHMTWGAVNELTTLTGYEQIIRKSQHPILKDLLGRIVKDERRHFAFYLNQAAERLGADTRNQRLTRRLMERAWSPVGTTVYDPIKIDEVSLYAFGDAEGRAAIEAANATIAKLPGMDGWTKLQDDVAAGAERHRRILSARKRSAPAA